MATMNWETWLSSCKYFRPIDSSASVPTPFLKGGEIVTAQNGQKWKVVRHIGCGHCCNVYRVHLAGQHNIHAALKVYKREAHYSAACGREMSVVKDVKHRIAQCPNIVHVQSAGTHDGQQLLITELLTGDLNHFFSSYRNNVIPLYTLQMFVRHMLSALANLHKCGYVHADIKPENVMWQPQEYMLKLFDFSVTFKEGSEMNHCVQSRSYRSPESFLWNAKVERRHLAAVGSNSATGAATATGSFPATFSTSFPAPFIDSFSPVSLTSQLSFGTPWPATSQSHAPIEVISLASGGQRHGKRLLRSWHVDTPALVSSKRVCGAPDSDPVPAMAVAGTTPTSSRGTQTATASQPQMNIAKARWSPFARKKSSKWSGGDGGKTGSIPMVLHPAPDCSGAAAASGRDDNVPQPTTAIDIWSIGCLIYEFFGGKPLVDILLKSSKPEMCESCRNSVMMGGGHRPSCHSYGQIQIQQLIRPQYDNNTADKHIISDLNDLASKCLRCLPENRITAAEALSHRFFMHKIMPTQPEMFLVPSPILRISHAIDDDQFDVEDDYAEILMDFQEECEKFGPVKICFIPKDGPAKGKAFIHFTFAHHCQRAMEGMAHQYHTFNDHPFMATYFPLDAWERRELF